MATSYDEDITPESDPPRREPPPRATLLGRIFAYRTRGRTVVQAPLVRVPHASTRARNARADEPVATVAAPDEPFTEGPPAPEGAPAAPPADAAVEAPPPDVSGQPDTAGSPGMATAPTATPPTATQPVATRPVATQPVAIPQDATRHAVTQQAPPPQPAAPVVATRYCPVCGSRVPVAADGVRCHRGHRLSPAHGRNRRGWLRRRQRPETAR